MLVLARDRKWRYFPNQENHGIWKVEDYPTQTALKFAQQNLKSLAVLIKQKYFNDVERLLDRKP